MDFLALGDSILSDCFPGPGRGVASLVFRNPDGVFPEFAGRDLSTHQPAARCHNLARTGNKLQDIAVSLERFSSPRDVGWILLSGGGNDVLLGNFDPAQVIHRHQQLLQALRSRFPQARLAVCNVYDPTQGTGQLDSDREYGGKPRWKLVQDIAWLNGVIAQHAGACLVDLHAHCLGTAECFQRDIEPSPLGASHMRGAILPYFL